jgi:hypothetical protein
MDSEYLEQALSLFERFSGISFSVTKREEVLRNHVRGVVLTHSPVVELLSFEGRTDNGGFFFNYKEIFGTTEWQTIDSSHVHISDYRNKKAVTFPPSIFGTPYTEVRVTYLSGISTLPEDVQTSIKQIAELLQSGEITMWNAFLPVEILDVIEKYRKEENA